MRLALRAILTEATMMLERLKKSVAAYDLAIQPLSKGTRNRAHPRPGRRFITPSCRTHRVDEERNTPGSPIDHLQFPDDQEARRIGETAAGPRGHVRPIV